MSIRSERCECRPASSRLARLLQSRTAAVVEAFLWTGGFLFAQALVLVVLLAVLLTVSFGTEWPGEAHLLDWVLETNIDRSFLLIGTPVLGAIFLILPAIRLREGREFREKIGWRRPTTDEAVYSLAMVTPVAIIGDLVYRIAEPWWRDTVNTTHLTSAFQINTLEQIHLSCLGVPYPVLVIAMALAPAVAEELVFRGMLGRQLVARLGVVWGVLISSLCFAAVHGSPPHAIATLPIAVLLHVLYLQTGTIWIPVLVHFCNNLLAVTLVRFDLAGASTVSVPFFLALCGYLMLMLLLLHIRSGHHVACER